MGADLAAAQEETRRQEELKGWLQCAWCQGWVKEDDSRLLDTYQEAFDARGCSYQCPLPGCGRRFWVSLATSPGETLRKYHKGGYHAFVGNT